MALKGCHSEPLLRGISRLDGPVILRYAQRDGRFLAPPTPLGMTPALLAAVNDFAVALQGGSRCVDSLEPVY